MNKVSDTFMEKDKLVKLVESLKELNSVTTDNHDTYVHKQEYHDLLMNMGSIISKICGNLNKIYEKTVELELLMEGVDVKHVNDTYGADLVITDGENKTNVEVKTSTVVESNYYKSNWNFVVNLKTFDFGDEDEDEEETEILENRLFEHIYENQYNGIIKIAAVNEGQRFYTCTLSGLFLSMLLAKMIVKRGTLDKNRKSINLGSNYCSYHKTYHRLDRLVESDLLLTQRMDNNGDQEVPSTTILNSDEWKLILNKTPSCKK